MRRVTVTAVLLACAVALAQPYRVGVLDVGLTGGRGASSAGFLGAFDDLPDYEAQPLSSLDLASLYRYDIVVLYDLHEPGQVTPTWRENLQEYAKTGGSLLSIYHQHLFPSIGPGVLKVGVREVEPLGDDPITEGITRFKTDWPDHIILQPGEAATVFLRNADGQPVAAYGRLGKGKLVNCGLALGINSDWATSKPPQGMEKTLLARMLDWLRPEERWPARLAAHAAEPRLQVWLDARALRQPSPVAVQVRGVMPPGAEPPAAHLAVVDEQGKRAEATRPLETQALAGTELRDVDQRIALPTEGLASGPARVTYAVSAGGTELQGEGEVRLVRATPPEREFRAFWTHAVEDRLPADIMPRIRACGFNAVIPRSSGGTGAFYLSRVLPDVKNILGDEDWLANCIEHAHRNGLQVHPYRNCFIMEGRAGKETIASFRAAGRLQEDPAGRPLDWMCPSQDVNRQVELAAATEFVRDYEVDGFQFDFIRCPSASGCFCPRCREKFEHERGARVERWPQDVVSGGALFEEYTRFRQQQITQTVAMVSKAIRHIRPEVRISAAVFRNYAQDSISVGQDWVTWAKEGYVDFLCPMDYTSDVGELDRLVRDQIERVGQYVPVCAGLGLAASRTRMASPEDLALQVDIARQAGCRGFVLFAWYPGCDEQIVLPQRNDCLAGSPPVPWE